MYQVKFVQLQWLKKTSNYCLGHNYTIFMDRQKLPLIVLISLFQKALIHQKYQLVVLFLTIQISKSPTIETGYPKLSRLHFAHLTKYVHWTSRRQKSSHRIYSCAPALGGQRSYEWCLQDILTYSLPMNYNYWILKS